MLPTAFLLGFLGSLHCVGMCGPLVLIMPSGQGGVWERGLRRAVYHLGRALVYGILGMVFGTIGQAVSFAGWQSGLSIAAGVAVLFLAWPRARVDSGASLSAWQRGVHRARRAWQTLLARPGLLPLFGLGALNGLLPCGLTFTALAAAALAGGPLAGFLFMFVFGLATMPALLAVAAAPSLLRPSWRTPLRRLAPAASVAMALLFVLRGLGLGIPFLSPDLSKGAGSCCAAPSEATGDTP